MRRKEILDSIIDIGVVPVVRTGSAESAVRAVEAVFKGGIRAAEITMTVPGLSARSRKSRMSSATGSRWAREPCSIRRLQAVCMLAGAQFLVTPVLEHLVHRKRRIAIRK